MSAPPVLGPGEAPPPVDGGLPRAGRSRRVLIVLIKNPPPPPGEKTSPGGTLVKPDVKMNFGPHQDQVLGLAQQFVLTAVRRNDVDASWEMVCPEMRQGYSRQSWAKGEIPVVPYPAQFAKWHLAYSYQREIDLQVALYAKPETKLKPCCLRPHPAAMRRVTRRNAGWCRRSSRRRRPAGTSAPTTTRATSARSRSAPRDPALYSRSGERSVARIPLGIMLGMLLDRARDRRRPHLYGQGAYNTYVRERRMPLGPRSNLSA